MNMYLYELRANRKFAITWLIILLIVTLMMCSMYPVISIDIETFTSMLAKFPKGISDAFGVDIKLMGSMLGYYSSFVLTITLVCGTLEAMILGLSILSKEEREKTADFLFAKPVSRKQIMIAKTLAILTLILISNFIYMLVTYFFLIIFAKVSINIETYVLLTLTLLLLQLLFYSLGMLISVLINKIKAVLPPAMGIVFGFYALSTFGDIKLRTIMPFKYFDLSYILNNSKYELKYLTLTFMIIIISLISTYFIYYKKDINAV